MSLLIRHNGNLGIKIFKLGWVQVEVWFILPNSVVPEHKHMLSSCWVMHLFGSSLWKRDGKEKQMPMFTRPKLHYIPCGCSHSATVGPWGLIILNVQQWIKTPTSAGIDFVEVKS